MKLLHVGDVHIGHAHYGSSLRRQDVVEALKKIFDLAETHKVDGVLLAGDVFNTRRLTAQEAKAFRNVIQRHHRRHAARTDVECPVIGIDGNHDNSDGGWLELLGVQTFFEDEHLIPIGKHHIMGFNYCRPELLMPKLLAVKEHCAAAKIRPSVCLLHYPLGDMAPLFGVPELTTQVLAPLLSAMGVSYAAMGDIHDFQHQHTGGVDFVYPGSIELTAISEQLPKSVILLDVPEDGGPVTWTRLHYQTRPALRAVIDTEADYEVFVEQLRQVRSSVPIVEVKINADLPDIYNRVRVLVHGLPQSVTRIPKKLVTKKWDKQAAKVSLADIVSRTFAPDTVENRLIMDMLAAPTEAVAIAETYLKEQGVMK